MGLMFKPGLIENPIYSKCSVISWVAKFIFALKNLKENEIWPKMLLI